NVANLMLARGSTRIREVALRSALGAGRTRLLLGVMFEALLIAALAAPIGWLGASWGAAEVSTMIASGEDPPVYWARAAIDGWAWLFVIGVTLLASLAAGLYPAWRAANLAKAPTLRDGGHGSTGRQAGRLSRALVLIEIAACTALLTAAGLALRSVQEIQTMPNGVSMDGVLTGRIGMFAQAYPDGDERRDFIERLQQRLQALPMVEQAAFTTAVPLQDAGRSELLVEGQTLPPAGSRLPSWFHSVVSPGYFDVFDIPLLAGRDFAERDRVDSQPVAIISQSLAERLWPGRDPLGQRFQAAPREADSPWLTVIGVVGDVRMDAEGFGLMDASGSEQFYQPYAQLPQRFISPVLRVRGEPRDAIEPLRHAVAQADPDMPVYWLRSMQDWLDIVLYDIRLMTWLFGLFASFALVLASAGLYAVLAYAVSLRTREIGVRRALGASRGNIAGLVAGQSSWQVGLGLCLGGVLGVGFGKALSSVLYGVGSFDPLTFATVSLVLAVAAALATWIPARRALAIEPLRALQQD
ncbi:MAG: FtsX-like permease family protein, partial [Xanthomonadales bacterium]|nr:FtsX-like permease family protein [Xanthomonadales bacterium]